MGVGSIGSTDEGIAESGRLILLAFLFGALVVTSFHIVAFDGRFQVTLLLVLARWTENLLRAKRALIS